MTDPKIKLQSFGTKPSFEALQRTSRHVRDSHPADFKIQIDDVGDEPPVDSASDSGIFNASKTASYSSNTFNDDTDDNDLADQEDQERVGVLDYYPSEPRKIQNRATERDPTGNFKFSFRSEAPELDKQRIIPIDSIEIESTSPSDTVATSSNNFQCKKEADMIKHFRTDGLESFDEDSATEMQDLSGANKNQQRLNDMIYDEAVNVESDDEGGTSSLHEKLYGVYGGGKKTYTSMIREEIEDYDSPDCKYRSTKPLLSVQNRRNEQGTITRHGESNPGKITVHDPRGYGAVDSVVDFKLKRDSDGSLMPSASFSRPSLEEGGARYNSRYEHTFSPRLTSSNGRVCTSPVSPTDLFARDNDKITDPSKRSKRKKKSKEDSPDGSSCKEASYDVNGNPVSGSALYPNLKMGNRISPRDTYGPGALEKRSAFPNSVSDFNTYNNVEGSHDPNSLKQKQQRKIKKKEKKESKQFKAEKIPGNRGAEDLHILVDYIENKDGKKKKKSIIQNGIVPSVSSDSSSAILDTKNGNKKAKEKKLKNNYSSLVGKDDKTVSENSSERGDDVSSKASDIYVEASENLQDSTNDLSLKDNDISSEISNSSTSACSGSKKEDTLNILADRYIFTDFSEIPQKEEEFKPVVNHRKKKRHQKEVVPVKETPTNEVKRTARRKYPQGARSVTPPPIPSSRVERPTDRAFSPSAFPVLGREGRRNSTGNAPLDANNQDDSDIESVRSLPLSSSVEKSINDVKSVVSYAKVAAGPNKLQGSASATGITGNYSNDFPVASPNGQNSDLDIEANSSHGELHSPTPVLQSPLSEISSRDGSVLDNSLWDAALGATAQSTPQKDLGGDSNLFEITDISFDTEYPVLGSGLANQTQETDKSIKVKSNGDTKCDDSVKEPSVVLGSASSSSSNNNSEKIVVKDIKDTGPVQSSSTKVNSANNSKKPKGKSVVFLDGKLNDSPKDLGISFGFDNSLEYSGPSESSPQTENHSDSGVNSPTNEAELSGNYSPDNAAGKNILDKTKAIEKLQTLANKNGVAVGKTLAAQGTRDAEKTQTANNYEVQGDCDIKQGQGGVYKSAESSDSRDQAYSLEEVPKQGNKVSAETQTIGAPKIDYNMDRSRFNYEDAVMFVKKEWDRVMSTSRKDSRKVLVYDSTLSTLK